MLYIFILFNVHMQTEDSAEITSLNRYICCSVFPLLSRFSGVFRRLRTDLYVVENFLTCCFRLYHSSSMSIMQLDEVVSFFIAILK